LIVSSPDPDAGLALKAPFPEATWSGIPVKPFYRPEDVSDNDYGRDHGDPGEFPYTRGIHHDMYRNRLWTHREICGYGHAVDTNKRMRYLLEQGNTGLNVIFDQVHMMGLDPTHPRAASSVGMMGVNTATLSDFHDLFAGIELADVNVSLINPTASGLCTYAMYIALAEERGDDIATLKGSNQNDTLHCRYFGYAPGSPYPIALRCAVDNIEFAARNMPRWYVATFNSHGWRETGIDAAQEIAFCFSRAKTYLRLALERGLDIDTIGPRIGFYAGAHMDMFEEVAKLRAARRLWARIMRDDFAARDPRSQQYRFGIHTVANTLTPQQPLINIARVAIQSVTAVLAGCQSLQACPYDEPNSLPTEESHRIALRTQQIVGYESGITKVADPLGGSWYVESLTDEVEARILYWMHRVEEQGGIVEAMRSGWIDDQMEQGAMQEQRRIDDKEQIVVGMNEFMSEDDSEELSIPVHRMPEGSAAECIARVERHIAKRDTAAALRALADVEEAARAETNGVRPAVEAAKAGATHGEIMRAIRRAFDYPEDIMEAADRGLLN
jgi:methylmalonyl-CoA mutase N-terminal domain/subunit